MKGWGKTLIKDLEIKEVKTRELLLQKGLSGVILSTQTNFLWFTGGRRNEVLKNADISLVNLFITTDKKYLISSSSDLDRVMAEELEGLGFEPVKYEWYDGSPIEAAGKLVPGGKIGADFSESGVENIEDGLMALRIELTEHEMDKAEKFCKQYSALLTDYCMALKPGITEISLANDFTCLCLKSGIRLPVALVGSDERIFKYRHPVATGKKIDSYVLFATVAEKDGINISVSRSMYFGEPPKEIIKKQEAVNQIEAAFCGSSKSGVSLGDVFKAGRKAYKDLGYEDEWKNHTQGGIIGYKAREIVATDLSEQKLKNNNLLSWNPTIAGAKAEDIYLLDGEKTRQLSIDERWPYMEISAGGQKFKMPKILQL